MLVNKLPQAAKDAFAKHPVSRTPAQWAFRWLCDDSAVCTVLSGVTTPEMTDDNVRIFSEACEGCMTDAEKNAEYLFFGRRTNRHAPDRLLTDKDSIPLGDTVITVHHTPGHSQGSVCYHVGNALFTGDTLFSAGYGRYDLYGGDPNALVRSLSSLRAFDQDLTIYPGHGGTSTLGAALDNLFGLT